MYPPCAPPVMGMSAIDPLTAPTATQASSYQRPSVGDPPQRRSTAATVSPMPRTTSGAHLATHPARPVPTASNSTASEPSLDTLGSFGGWVPRRSPRWCLVKGGRARGSRSRSAWRRASLVDEALLAGDRNALFESVERQLHLAQRGQAERIHPSRRGFEHPVTSRPRSTLTRPVGEAFEGSTLLADVMARRWAPPTSSGGRGSPAGAGVGTGSRGGRDSSRGLEREARSWPSAPRSDAPAWRGAVRHVRDRRRDRGRDREAGRPWGAGPRCGRRLRRGGGVGPGPT